ncbi:MAG: aminotransferase class III-fold pyridoxal phosphate-dependent enzyme [Deltaproteobacteria bacterium]|nr:aminotransferase class III-fold pyridoxal phosphate-dependent enzyme [Deltaproteobacteria bacterium]
MPNSVCYNDDYPVIRVSDEWYGRALDLIPAATQTLAKGPGQFVKGVAPKFVCRGKGARVWDVDGNEYLDLNMAVGPVILGYGDSDVDDAIREQLRDGISFSLVHPLEVEVAERIHQLVPNAEMVRFAKSGAEVTSAAVRLARAYTGRDKVVCCGYHGWHDWYISVTDRNRGVPEATRDLTYTFEYDDLASLVECLDEDVACVILEPVTVQIPSPNFFQNLQTLCQRNGSLLIFDEMWTGFRIALGGAQQYFDVKPDLACFSKAVANGMPISVLTGRRDVMRLLDRDVFFFSTFGGETLSLAAARATIDKLRATDALEYIARLGVKLRDGLAEIADTLDMPYLRSIGLAYRTMVTFDPEVCDALLAKSLLQQELIRRGILWSGFHTLSAAHTDSDIEYVLDAYRDALPILRDAIANDFLPNSLRGEKLEPVFRRTSLFHTKPKKAQHPDTAAHTIQPSSR